MKYVLKALDFCSLLDYSGTRLSLTNIALLALVAKLAFSQSADWGSIVAVVTAFGNYSLKRVVNSKSEGPSPDVKES